jgi:hypothetical protein
LEHAGIFKGFELPNAVEPIDMDTWKYATARYQKLSAYWRSGEEITVCHMAARSFVIDFNY